MEHGIVSKKLIAEIIETDRAQGKRAHLLAGDWSERYAVAALVLNDVMPEAEVHEGAADVFTCVDGEVAFTLGGELAERRMTGPGEWKGASIQGGETRRVTVGDVVSIPKGVPHQMDTRGGRAVLLIVKVRDL